MIRTKVGTYVKRTTDEFIAIAKKVHKDRYQIISKIKEGKPNEV